MGGSPKVIRLAARLTALYQAFAIRSIIRRICMPLQRRLIGPI